MAKTVSGRKAKGRRAQQEVAQTIREKFPDLTERDVVSLPMGVPGVDIMLSEQAFDKFPFAIEVKNTERLSIWKELKQAEQEERKGIPLLCFTRNRTPMYVALKMEDFIDLLN